MNLFELFVKIGVDDQASGKLKSLSSKLGSGLKTAAKVGTAAVAAVGSGMAALGTYAAKVGGDFEAQMSKVSAISGATGDDLQELEDKAKQLGIDTKFSATEAGQAFEYMAMAGWKTEQMLDGVAGIMDLAAASGEDLASVSDIVTDAMTAFGLSAEQSTHFADVLAKASSNANTNVGLMGETFKYVAPVAGAMGFSVEDTATAIGLMANAGIKGSQAGTALRSMFSRLAKPTKESGTAMNMLGLEITNTDGSMRSLSEIMVDIRKGFDRMTEAEQAQVAGMLAGQEAMSGLLAIVNTSEAEYDKLTTAIYSADGASKQMADTMANNLHGKLTLLKSSAEGFGLALYDKIQKPLTEMASWAVESLNELTTAFNENGVDGVVEAVGNILSEAMTTVFNKLPKFLNLAVSVVKKIISSIAGELPSIIRAISDIVPDVISAIEELIPEIISAIGEIFPEIIALIEDVFPDIVNLVLENLPSLLQTIFEAIPGVIESLGSIISEIVPTLVQTIVQVVQLVADNIGTIIDSIIAVIPVITEAVNNAILENFPALLQSIIQLVLNIIDKLPEIIQMMVDQIGPIVSTIVQVIVENLPAFIEGIVKIIWGIIKALPSIIVSLAQAVWEAFKGIGVGIINAWPKFKEGIVSLWNKVTDWFAGIWNKTKEIGGNIISGIKEGIKNAWNNLVSWFKGLFNDLIGIAKKILGIASPSKVFKKLGGWTAEGFGIGFDDEFARVKGDMEDALAFDDVTMGVNASMYKNGSGALSGLHGGTSIGSVSINIDGARFDDEQSLAEAVAEAIQSLTDRRSAVYA